MTSRAKNWAVLAAVGAIFSLVVLIVYIWTGYKSSPSSSSASTARDPLQEPKGLTTGELDVSTLFPSTGIGPDTSTSESTPTTQTPGRRQLSIGEVLGDDQLMEEVRPIKLPPPLEEEALDPQGEEPPPRLRHERHHHTGGHFRARSPGLWDPHPRYAFSAFGRRFRLDLALDARFLSPHLRVTTIWQGSEHGAMIREKKPAVEDHGSCFYSGTVYGDPSSSVAVNLCHGMTGHIRTAEGSFFIEPIQEWLPQSPTTLHAIYRVSGSPPPPPSFPAPTEAPSSCGLDESMHKPKINHNKLLAPVGLPDHSSRSTEVHEEEEDDYEDEDEEEDDEEDEDEDEEGGEKESKKKKGENTTIEGGERERRRRKKRSVSMEYFVEVMVVADRKMIDYHGSGLVSYVLTLMSIVSLIYKDASIGNPMTVAVVKLVQLNEDFTANSQRRRDSSEGTSAPDMLKNFCEWQSKINQRDDSSPAHHDTALLLTRENICRNPALNKCDTLGLAELGTMCEEYTSCAIVQDNGLSAAFTIAHELGHVLNMPHDDDVRCKHFLGGTRVHNVMSRMLDHNTHPWSWSNCSRHFMTEFLEAGRGECLLDHPPASTTNETKEEKLPGESFTEDRQCEFVFGTGSKICSYMPVCSRLWCTTALGEEQEGCRTQHMPWADGTSCGGGMWCQKGKCVAQNRSALLPVDGGWSQWQRWGPCSRTCGGGIKKSERACASPPPANGGKYCIGERVRIRSCRKTECPAGSRDFREVQCAQFNNNNFSIHGLPSDVKWVPKYDGISPSERCKLYCRVSHTNAYYRLGDKVKDGTTCGPNTYDMCVNGLCHSADCSHTINPVKHLDVDICGKCGGDNSTCKMIGGKYNISSYGYRRVIPIPAGSSNLDIRQSVYRGTSKDDNYLALVNPETGDYLLNGNFIVSPFRKLIVYGGTTIEYSGSSAVVERINSSRPLSKDLILEVLSVGKLYPPNIYYQYTVLSKPEYRWEMKLEWTRCSSMCQGEQVRKPVCIRVSSGTGEIVGDHFCIHLIRPRSYVQVCNTHCILRWKVSHETPCSARSCTKNRTVQCVREDPSRNGGMSQVSVLNESVCQHISSKPHLQIPCQRPCHGTWQYSAWSPCSASCGEGIEKRKYICMGSDGQELLPKFCKGGKHHVAEERRKCKIQDCPRWATGEWTPCSVTCGSGEQQRPYWCELEGKAVAEAYCRSRVGHHESIPIHVQQCKASPCTYHSDRDNWIQEEGIVPTAHPSSSSSPLVSPTTALALPRTPPPPPSSSRWHYNPDHLPSFPVSRHGSNFRWRAGLWGPCSETCKEEGGKSNGYLRRLVACQDEHGRDADDSLCPHTERPLDVTPCQLLPICPKWMHGEWGPCNVSCGEGRQFREVGCRGSEGQALAETKCSPIKRPSSVRVCAVVSCPSWPPQKPRQREPKFVWKAWHWEKCSTTCGPGFQRRRVSCHRVNRAGSGDPEHLESLPAGPGPPHYCLPSLKPAEHQHCHIAECGPQYRWKTGRWKPCSEPCGKKGKQRRVVSCIKFKADGQTKRVPKHHCPQSQKPQARQKCNRHSCDFSTCEIIRESKWRQHGSNVNLRDGEYHLLIRGISMSIYCHGMGTRTNSPKEYLTLPTGETENFSEFYDRRLLNPNTCPDGGVRRDDCDCTIDSNGKGGLTVFSRVRINVTSLRIDTSDMTFTRQKQGSRVAYGKAGDCYSSLDCPQGRFSINLKGTKLRVHDDVKWEGSGASAAVHIEKREDGQSVIGRCGGYCGACQPAGAPWISLDIMPPRNEGGLR